MYIVRNVKVSLDSDFSDVKELLSKVSNIKDIQNVVLYKRSVDARKKDNVYFNCTFLADCKTPSKLFKKFGKNSVSEYTEKKYVYEKATYPIKPIIVGFGPAGMFAALALAKAGLCPVVLERGKDVDSRKKDIDNYFHGGDLNTESNVQFGEGGAGTFSDGKLNTGINDYRIREILKILNQHGADSKILYDSKPHIGTDILMNVVKSIRNEIINLGGEILFEHKLIDIKQNFNHLESICVKYKDTIKTFKTDHLVLAIGHSARDTYEKLKEVNINMEPKAFAVGVRIEHKQKHINQAQYGEFCENKALGAADYKLSTHLSNGRGVFSFCMCPGGEVINASSEKECIAVNGMSNSARNGENANSAILVGINVEDYFKNDILDGIRFQREIEKRVYNIGKGRPITQKFVDFKNNNASQDQGEIQSTVLPKPTLANIRDVFPEYINSSLIEGITSFNTKIKGFADDDALLTAPETRSSSPIRILRDECGNSSIIGIYPCGEGAGYAGGIMSAAVDGLKTAENIIKNIKKASD